MEFEWDEAKAASSLAKHGVGFEVVHDLDWSSCPIVDDDRFDYGEARYVAYARSSIGLRYVIAFTLRRGSLRIISVRPFGRREYRIYGE